MKEINEKIDAVAGLAEQLVPDKKEAIAQGAAGVKDVIKAYSDGTQPKWRSWALWVAVAALVVFSIKIITGVDYGEQVNTILNIALPALAAFGIINNPNSKNTL